MTAWLVVAIVQGTALVALVAYEIHHRRETRRILDAIRQYQNRQEFERRSVR
jgi:heme exporter protein D